MEPTLTETAQTLPMRIQWYARLIFLITIFMNILGWGSCILWILLGLPPIAVAFFDLIVNVLMGSYALLFFLVPGSLLANLILLFLTLIVGRKEYGGINAFLKHLAWKDKRFIKLRVSSLFYLAGCTLFILLFFPSILRSQLH